jgi:hypothetical protein
MPFDGVGTPFNHVAQFDQVIQLLERPRHWVKRSYANRRGQYCLVGALNAVGVRALFEQSILKTIAEVVTDKEFCCVESFNDHPETQHGDVVAVLQRTREAIAAGKFALPPRDAVGTVWGAPQPLRAEGRVAAWWRGLFA